MTEPYSQTTLSRLKEIELESFKAFISVCEILNLKYYILGGTLLGAVRHKGFIPWDDDIDVGMPRADYEIFIREGQALLPKNLFIQSIHSEDNYIMCFAKIRNSNTTFIETSVRNLKINHGIYIDIFPLDFYPEKKSEQQRFWIKKRLYDRRIACKFTTTGSDHLLYKLKSLIVSCMYPSIKHVKKKREILYTKLSNSSLLANLGGAWGIKEIMPASWYGDGIKLEFEDLYVNAPRDYDKWLTHVYGNYMELPPIEERVGHHYADIIDTEKSFEHYIN